MEISDEAVEVLASRDWAKDSARSDHEFPSWDEASRDNEWTALVKEYRDDARAALEAAAPHLMAEALEEAAKDLAFGFGPINQRRTDEWLNARAWKLRRGNQVRSALDAAPNTLAEAWDEGWNVGLTHDFDATTQPTNPYRSLG